MNRVATKLTVPGIDALDHAERSAETKVPLPPAPRGEGFLRRLDNGWHFIDRQLHRWIPSDLNPFHQLGAMANTCLIIAVISGVLDADSGEVELFGVEWSKLSIGKKTDRRGEIVGFVFQQFNHNCRKNRRSFS